MQQGRESWLLWKMGRLRLTGKNNLPELVKLSVAELKRVSQPSRIFWKACGSSLQIWVKAALTWAHDFTSPRFSIFSKRGMLTQICLLQAPFSGFTELMFVEAPGTKGGKSPTLFLPGIRALPRQWFGCRPWPKLEDLAHQGVQGLHGTSRCSAGSGQTNSGPRHVWPV